jgi:hypothetical protein
MVQLFPLVMVTQVLRLELSEDIYPRIVEGVRLKTCSMR